MSSLALSFALHVELCFKEAEHGKKAKASAILVAGKKKTILQGLLIPDFLLAQAVKNLSAVLEIWVQSLGQKDPLEKGMATHLLQYSCLGNAMDRGA